MRIVATYGVWREPQWLVDEMRANLAWVDGFAEVDDRDRTGGWGNEGEYRRRQRAACIEAGADWVLVTSPDERWELGAGDKIRGLAEAGRDVFYRFKLCEMWTPKQYRVDGRWGRLRRTRLYRLRDGQTMSTKRIHAPPIPVSPKLPTLDVDIRVYHLKMINPQNRPARRAAYLAAEGTPRRQRWGHLTDEAGIHLATPEPGRGFAPRYTRDYRFLAG